MPKSKAPLFFLFSLLFCCVYFFWHFLLPLIAAAIMCFVSHPLYRHVGSYFKTGSFIPPLLMISAWVVALVLPLAYLGVLTVRESQLILQAIALTNDTGAVTPGWLPNIPIAGEQLADYWRTHLSAPGQMESTIKMFIGSSWSDVSKTMLLLSASLGGFALAVLFCFITLFFLYKDGDRILHQLDLAGGHLLSEHWPTLSRLIPKTVSATVVGMSTIAIAEGVILGVAYHLAGAPSALILGVITGVMAMIPGGAPLAFSCVSLYLVATGNSVEGFALFAWGCAELFIIDKTIRPVLVGGPVKLPFLPTFFGLIGGVKTMGVLGLFIGPVLMALLVSVWRAWMATLAANKARIGEPPRDIAAL